MIRTMLHGDIHCATVTQADLHYVGSLIVEADSGDAGHAPGYALMSAGAR